MPMNNSQAVFITASLAWPCCGKRSSFSLRGIR
jgi:hypothetical protein